MQANDLLKYLESQDLKRIDSGRVALDDVSSSFIHIVIDNSDAIELEVSARDCAAQIVVINEKAKSGNININIADGAKANIVEVLFDGAASVVSVTQGRDSETNITLLEVGTTDSDFIVNLNGEGATSKMDVLQLVGGTEQGKVMARIAHNAAGCTSRSVAKCIAGGESRGEFRGLVYVAKDAQRTEAHQNSRNIALSSSAKIVAEPQLEIYADDVKCSHGATVGQMNKDAVFYMQQRGLSEDAARKLQLEGFVAEITSRCAVEALAEGLSAVANDKLSRC